MDGGIDSGKSVAPISSWNPNEMRISGERRERPGQEESRKRRQHSGKSIHAIVGELNKAMVALGKKISFAVTDEGQYRVINMVNAETNMTIRQLSVDEILNAPNLSDLLGVLVDKDG
jgi:uncharacterized FlaG/YvyC family protein